MPHKSSITERHIQAIWYDRELRPPNLVTRRGLTVHVIDPGTWNPSAGPDFKNAVLEIGRDHRILRGDVEIHLSPSDWDAHGHGGDPEYKDVIAHVTLGCGPDPASLPANAVSIWLGRFLTAEVSFSPEAIDLGAYPFGKLPMGDRPCREYLGDDPDKAGALLISAGRERLVHKAERLRRMLSSVERQQLFYSEVMRAFGYSGNASAFYAIARAVPLSVLETEPGIASEVLMAASGFTELDHRSLRPNNRPTERLRAAAQVFTEGKVMELADAEDFSRHSCASMLDVMRPWVGRGRCAAVLANVVVPMALAEGRLSDVPEWLPPEDVPRIVKVGALRLFGRDVNPRVWYADNDVKIQGMLHILRTICADSFPYCKGCGIVREGKMK